MSIEWDSLILGGNELNTVGPATENARQANSVRTRGTNSRGAPAERIGLAGAATRTGCHGTGNLTFVIEYFRNRKTNFKIGV